MAWSAATLDSSLHFQNRISTRANPSGRGGKCARAGIEGAGLVRSFTNVILCSLGQYSCCAKKKGHNVRDTPTPTGICEGETLEYGDGIAMFPWLKCSVYCVSVFSSFACYSVLKTMHADEPCVAACSTSLSYADSCSSLACQVAKWGTHDYSKSNTPIDSVLRVVLPHVT